MKRKWTDEQLISAVKISKTKAEVLRKIGLASAGAYKSLNYHIDRLGLSTDHFLTGKEKIFYTRKVIPRKISDQDLFRANGNYHSGVLKRRIISKKLLPYRCLECGISEWNDKPLTLQLDHINGISNDNRIENLRLLCPNCHSQTPTFSTRKLRKEGVPKKCLDCDRKINRDSIRCRKCSGKFRKSKIALPAIDYLLKEVNANGYLSTARKLGVSDNAIRKHINKYRISLMEKAQIS